MDEVGTAVKPSDHPNAHLSPFVCLHLDGIAFSLLYLLEDAPNGAEITSAAPKHA